MNNQQKDLFSFHNYQENIVSKTFKQKSLYSEAFSIFRKNKTAVISAILFFGIILSAIIIVSFAQDPYALNPSEVMQAPSKNHWFGTDKAGRDLWSRVWWAVLISSVVALIASSLNIVIATVVGISSGMSKWTDRFFSVILKIIFSVPTILILIIFSIVFGASYETIILGMIVTSWAGSSQQIRAQTLRIKNLDFITASMTLKANKFQIAKTYFVYSIPLIIMQFSILFPRMILLESTLGFLGLSIPNVPMLGTIISDGRDVLIAAPWISLFPSAFLISVVGTFTFVAFGLEDAFSGRVGVKK